MVVRGKGADLDVFLTKFWDNWRGRAWETGNADVTSGSVSGSGSTSSGLYTKEGTVRMVGVSGILRKEQEMWETTDKSLQDAFQDLNALMVIFSLFAYWHNCRYFRTHTFFSVYGWF